MVKIMVQISEVSWDFAAHHCLRFAVLFLRYAGREFTKSEGEQSTKDGKNRNIITS